MFYDAPLNFKYAMLDETPREESQDDPKENSTGNLMLVMKLQAIFVRMCKVCKLMNNLLHSG